MTLETDNLSMELSSLDTRIPVENGWIKVESLNLKPHTVTAPDGVYSAQVQTDSNLLRFTGCRLTIVNGEITALLTAKNNNFDYIYLGPAADANADPTVGSAGNRMRMGFIPTRSPLPRWTIPFRSPHIPQRKSYGTTAN